MRRLAFTLGATAAGVGLLVAVLLAVSTVPRARVLDGYVLFVGGLLMLGLVSATREASAGEEGSLYERALRRRERPSARPHDLAKLERAVALGASSSFDVHVRVRPVLRQIASHRLAARRGVDLDSGTPEVRAALGEELWELLRPEREPPDDRFGPGLPVPRLRAAVELLERI
jgi:hypothetical protein